MKTVSFLKNKIIPIYVFDNDSSDIKQKTLDERYNIK